MNDIHNLNGGGPIKHEQMGHLQDSNVHVVCNLSPTAVPELSCVPFLIH